MVAFRPVQPGSYPGGGRPALKVPPRLAEYLKQTYETETICEIPISEEDVLSVDELIKLAQAYCRRRKKSLWHRQEDGVLKLRMRDKRVYSPRTPKESEDVA